jgi:hypothetical protein
MISPTELVAFVNASYAQADANLAQAGQKPNRVFVPKRYAVLFSSTDSTAIAPAATQTKQINISANGDFFLTRFLFAANIANAAQTYNSLVVPQLRIQITDSGSDEQFCNQSCDISSVASLSVLSDTGGGCDEPYPRVISGRSTVTVAITNTEAANTYNVEFILVGVLVKTWAGNL